MNKTFLMLSFYSCSQFLYKQRIYTDNNQITKYVLCTHGYLDIRHNLKPIQSFDTTQQNLSFLLKNKRSKGFTRKVSELFKQPINETPLFNHWYHNDPTLGFC